MLTPEQDAALEVARQLARVGVPLFLAEPDPTRPTGYREPKAWHLAEPDPAVADYWRPGMALCAVTGRALDLVDLDPRSGGELPATTQPVTYAWADTPSGGRHLWVAPLRVESRDGVWPGVDIKSGTEAGAGRGFGFIAPTVRRSKVDGVERPYAWREVALERLGAGGEDTTGWEVRQRVADLRAAGRPDESRPRVLALSAAREEWDRATARLVADLRTWAATGWGGAAHAGLLAHSTHLARLAPEHAEAAYLAAFMAAGLAPDAADLAKLESALDRVVPDQVVPDEQLGPTAAFWAGAARPPDGGPGPDPRPAGPEHARAGDFRFLTEAEVESIPEPDRLVDGLLWTNTVARLHGPSTVGKTWVLLDLAAHVACGMTWQGREVKQGPVLFVAAEGAPGMGVRVRAWRSRHGRPTGVAFWPEAVQVAGEHWGAFTAACAELGPVLVVLDTQAAMTVGLNENSNSDASRMLAAFNGLRAATGACVLLAHHPGHDDPSRGRGASGAFAGLDTELRLEGKGGGLLLHAEKQKYARRDRRPVRLRLAEHGGALVVEGPPPEQAASFFGDDVDIRARVVVERLRSHAAAGGSFRPTVRAITKVLREDLNLQVGSEVIRRACHLYMTEVGIPVSLSGRPDEE